MIKLKKVEISVIVPIYNVESYLYNCLISLQKQSYQNFEVIMVDDGSTDNSPAIAKNFEKTDERFQLYQKTNGGVSSARNIGLELVKGNYIAFVDGDDSIKPNFLSDMYQAIVKNKAEIAICDFQKIDEKYELIEKYHFNTDLTKDLFTGREILSFLMDKDNLIFDVVWNKLYRKDLFDDLHFEEGSNNEDEIILIDLFWNTKRVVHIRSCLYNYLQRSDSLINTQIKIKDIDRLNQLNISLLKFYANKDQTLYQKRIRFYKSWIVENYYYNNTIISASKYQYFQQQYRNLVKISKFNNIKVAVKDLLGYISLDLLTNIIKIWMRK